MKTDKMTYDEIVSFSAVHDCSNCEMNMGGICAGAFYGKEITEKIFQNSSNCPEWEMDINSYISLCSDINNLKIFKN